MYTVLVVDDEEWALAGAMHTFPFSQYDFIPILATTDALEAAECLRQRKPDVIIADIRMPEISGLDLLELSADVHPEGLFILLSGYGEFSYAQQAIRLRAFEYCLKPLKPEHAAQVLSKAAQTLRARAADAPKDAEDRFSELVAYVEAHYREPIRQADICRIFSMHPSYCSRLFTQRLGHSFMDHLTGLRMREARRLLHGGAAVKQVADRVGYTDYYSFIKAYARFYGISPSVARKGADHAKDGKDSLPEA